MRFPVRTIAAVLLFAAVVLADSAQACVPWRPKIYFQPGSVRPLDAQGSTLEGIASTMERMPTANLVLISHTEVELDERRSEELAESRADIMAEELTRRGVSPRRISIRPEGSAGDRDTLDVAMSNYVWFVLTDSAGTPLTCSGT